MPGARSGAACHQQHPTVFGIGHVQLAAYVDNLFDSVFIVAQDATIRRYSRPRVTGLQLRYRW